MRRGPWAGALIAALLALSVGSPAESAPAAHPGPCASRGEGVDSFCTIAGVRIHFVDWGGHGPPVILLAGLGSSARVFDDLAPRLARGHRVLALTRRGYGQSSAAQDYSNTALVGDVLGVMDGLSLTRAAFVGHSLAGGELSALGAHHPDRVDRLVYLDAAFDRTPALALTNGVPAGAPPGPPDLASIAAYGRWREGVLQSRSPAVRRDVAETTIAAPGGVRPRTSLKVMLAILDGDIAAPANYAAIPAPALAIYASKDVADQVPPATAPQRRREIVEYFRRHIRPWMLRSEADFIEKKSCGVAVELPHSTHHFFLRSPGLTARMLLSYLDTAQPCAWRPPAGLDAQPW
jgi:pimeloyl-ACP methyl ester carboxylesterase